LSLVGAEPGAPYTASSIKYVGVEGSLNANLDNFTVRAGTVTDPPPDSVAAPATPAPAGADDLGR
jgi:hypothetical protein